MALTDIDRELLLRCIGAEPAGWKDFVDRFIGLFVHVIQHTAHSRSLKLSQHDVDDLCAEVFLTLVANDYTVLRHFRCQASLATYLTVIARRVTVRELAKRRISDGPSGLPLDRIPAPSAVTSKDQQRIDNREEVARMLEGLPEKEAAVIQQFHLEGRTYEEISSQLGVPENSIGPTLTRARDKIRSNAK